MFTKKLFLLLALMTPALHGSMRMRYEYETAPPQSHVQSVLQMAHQTASHTPSINSRIQAAHDTHAVYHGRTPQSYASRPVVKPFIPSVPASNTSYYRTSFPPLPATVVHHHTTYIPRAPSSSTYSSSNDRSSWVPSKKAVLIAAITITGACILVYLITHKNKAATTEVVLVPTPALTTAAGQAPTPSAWRNAYNRLSLRDKHTIDELHLEQRGDYHARLKGTVLEQQEINNLLLCTKSGADIVYAAQTQFLNYFYAYEKQLNDATLAQHVIRSSDRLMILYNYFNVQ